MGEFFLFFGAAAVKGLEPLAVEEPTLEDKLLPGLSLVELSRGLNQVSVAPRVGSTGLGLPWCCRFQSF